MHATEGRQKIATIIVAIEMRIDCFFLLSQIECNSNAEMHLAKPWRLQPITLGLLLPERPNGRPELFNFEPEAIPNQNNRRCLPVSRTCGLNMRFAGGLTFSVGGRRQHGIAGVDRMESPLAKR